MEFVTTLNFIKVYKRTSRKIEFVFRAKRVHFCEREYEYRGGSGSRSCFLGVVVLEVT